MLPHEDRVRHAKRYFYQRGAGSFYTISAGLPISFPTLLKVLRSYYRLPGLENEVLSSPIFRQVQSNEHYSTKSCCVTVILLRQIYLGEQLNGIHFFLTTMENLLPTILIRTIDNPARVYS